MKNEIGSQGQNAAEASRTEVALPDVYVHPLLTYYPPTGIVERDGEQFSVLPKLKREAFNELFLPNPNRAISPEEILQSGFTTSRDAAGVRTWIFRMRHYLSPDPEEGQQIIQSASGKYMFRDESKPVVLIQKDPEYVDFHVRVKKEQADEFEGIMDQFGKLVVARRLQLGAEAVLFTGESLKKSVSRVFYSEPEIESKLPILDGGDFKFDPNIQALVFGDKNIYLTSNEAKLAYLIMSNTGMLVTKARAELYLQDDNHEVSDRTYRRTLALIKAKLRENIDDFVDPFEIVRGKGIIFHDSPNTVE